LLVGNAEEIESIAERIAAAPLVAFDLEFLTADRLIPVLCVLQVSWVSVELDAGTDAIVAAVPEIRVIDAQAVDVRPVLRRSQRTLHRGARRAPGSRHHRAPPASRCRT
jgi:hypothetical protein